MSGSLSEPMTYTLTDQPRQREDDTKTGESPMWLRMARLTLNLVGRLTDWLVPADTPWRDAR